MSFEIINTPGNGQECYDDSMDGFSISNLDPVMANPQAAQASKSSPPGRNVEGRLSGHSFESIQEHGKKKDKCIFRSWTFSFNHDRSDCIDRPIWDGATTNRLTPLWILHLSVLGATYLQSSLSDSHGWLLRTDNETTELWEWDQKSTSSSLTATITSGEAKVSCSGQAECQ